MRWVRSIFAHKVKRLKKTASPANSRNKILWKEEKAGAMRWSDVATDK